METCKKEEEKKTNKKKKQRHQCRGSELPCVKHSVKSQNCKTLKTTPSDFSVTHKFCSPRIQTHNLRSTGSMVSSLWKKYLRKNPTYKKASPSRIRTHDHGKSLTVTTTHRGVKPRARRVSDRAQHISQAEPLAAWISILCDFTFGKEKSSVSLFFFFFWFLFRVVKVLGFELRSRRNNLDASFVCHTSLPGGQGKNEKKKNDWRFLPPYVFLNPVHKRPKLFWQYFLNSTLASVPFKSTRSELHS